MKLKLLPDSDPILRLKAKTITVFDKSLKDLKNNMLFTMDLEGGVGLAAPQIGQSISMFVMRPLPEDAKAYYFINPKILTKGKLELKNEGCLSLKGETYCVERSTKILVEYQDLDGQTILREFEGWKARIFQHEYDHLMGVLISDIGVKV